MDQDKAIDSTVKTAKEESLIRGFHGRITIAWDVKDGRLIAIETTRTAKNLLPRD